MALITLDGVGKSFGAQQILDEAGFTLGASEKIALVGPNGSGKTTILKLILGIDEPDSGIVRVLPGTTIGFMPQHSELDGENALVDEVSNASVEIAQMEKDLRRLESAMGTAEGEDIDSLLHEYGEIQHEFDRLGGYAFEAEVKSTLSGLGLGPEHWEKPVSILSGGQKTRAALAKLLLQKPDVLLLDEPTNHLDIDACEWLEEFLQDFPGAALVVSHDRYFLDRVVTKVLDLHERSVRTYPGNYTAYAKQREEYLRQRLESYERQQQEILKLEDFIRRYHAGQRHTEAKSRQKKLDKMVRVRKPKLEPDRIRMKIESAMTSGGIVMDLREVGKSFGDTRLFTGLDLIVENGDRIGLIGANGTGKTTLLRMIIGDEEPTVGSIGLGYGVEMGYFSQDLAVLDPANTILEELLDTADMTSNEARSLAAKFLFKGEDVFKSVSCLSGGEINRLVLAKLVLKKPNVLVLDEPTNHLDIDAREALDRALKDFSGTIILTSHDRYLLNSIATKIVEIAGGVARVYKGDYEYFAQRKRLLRPGRPRKKPKPVRKTAVQSGPKGPSAADIEREIEAAETRLAELTDLLGRQETYADPGKSGAYSAEYDELSSRIQSLYTDWETLTETEA